MVNFEFAEYVQYGSRTIQGLGWGLGISLVAFFRPRNPPGLIKAVKSLSLSSSASALWPLLFGLALGTNTTCTWSTEHGHNSP